jgi:protein-tyrosine phosphatase
MDFNWINAQNFRLVIVPRPRGGDWLLDDLRAYKRAGIDLLVSLLTAAESHELGLSFEAKYCNETGIRFLTFPIEDRSVPSSMDDFSSFVNVIESELSTNSSLGIHCRAGIGRSSLLAACLLSRNGYAPSTAFDAIAVARKCSVPDTAEQRLWVGRWVEIRANLSNRQ